ncbi:MAG TPA: hypothetical protein VFT04_06805 [Gemmatimonadales bacterium]|nr:hypothetical protein [Gemmatimonadales bacterium]
MSPEQAGAARNERIPLVEKVIGALSAIVVLGLMAFLAARALGNDGAPPDIVVEMRGVTQSGAGWLVEVEVTNLGSTAASNLEVEGEMPAAGGTERRSVLLDYVPAQSSRRAGLFFTGDPRTRPITLRAVGYRSP